jgi:hypothetical protein
MTRKGYVLIAAALRDTLLIDCPTQEYLSGAKAAARSAAHPRFDRERFLAACGVQS